MSLGIYSHIPFCARRCDYCDFFVVVGREQEALLFDILSLELEQAAARPEVPAEADTLYLGGGTPSYVDPGKIETLVGRAADLFGLHGAEISLEANPEGVSSGTAAAWLAAGVNRLSLGVQSFSDDVLRPRGRLYTSAGAFEAARAARGAGFCNLSIDLIAGLPLETPASFAAGLDQLIDLAPDHVSVYLLETAESGKMTSLSAALDGGRVPAVSEDHVVQMYAAAVDRLPAAGYHQYEISNFARPGFESRHNMKYWNSTPWLGVGPSAHSFIGGRRLSRPADIGQWAGQVRQGKSGEDYTLPDAGERAREALTLQLRLAGGVSLDSFRARWGLDAATVLSGPIEEMLSDGLLHREGDRLALTPRGILFSNEVFGRLT